MSSRNFEEERNYKLLMSAWWKNSWLNTFDIANLHSNVPNSTMFYYSSLRTCGILQSTMMSCYCYLIHSRHICRQYLPTSFLLFSIRISMTQLLHPSGCSGLPYFNQLQLFVSQSETTRLSPKSKIMFAVV